jgi:hypothetical protein
MIARAVENGCEPAPPLSVSSPALPLNVSSKRVPT